MSNRGVFITVGVALVAFVLFLHSCDKKQIQEITSGTLKPAEREAIIVNPDTKEITTLKRTVDKSGKSWTSKETITGAREVRVAIDNQGRTTITAKTKGFEFRPGLALGVAETYRMGVDVEWAYWKNWGVLTGISTNIYKKAPYLSVYVGADYRLPWKITRNTSVFVSFDHRKNVFAGMRVEL